MTLSLQKGGNVSLQKEAPGMVKILVGLGWDARTTDGADFDLDASAFLLQGSGKVRSDSDFIFYNQKQSENGAVQHTGDNLTGQGDGDDETILVDINLVPADIQKVVFTITIHEAESRRQNFGQVRNAYIRIVNRDNNQEVVRFDLTEEYSTETAMIFGEIYRYNNEWKFRAIGQGFSGGLRAMANNFGIQI
ncbi:MAG: TerD family protein [Magnetococcus sp. YQC-5]